MEKRAKGEEQGRQHYPAGGGGKKIFSGHRKTTGGGGRRRKKTRSIQLFRRNLSQHTPNSTRTNSYSKFKGPSVKQTVKREGGMESMKGMEAINR